MLSPTNNLISLENIWMTYDSKIILRDICLSVNKGDFIAITGPNGGGKTTLLRILLKLIKPTKGTVTYRIKPEASRLPIGYLPQKNSIDSHFPVTVEEVISAGLLNLNDISPREKSRRIDDTIAMMGLRYHARQPIGQLSGGQLQRALLGRAVISQPEILVLDEPLSYIDKRFEHHLYDIIGTIARDATIVLVSHEMSTISGMATRHLIIDHNLHECTSPHHSVHYDCDEP